MDQTPEKSIFQGVKGIPESCCIGASNHMRRFSDSDYFGYAVRGRENRSYKHKYRPADDIEIIVIIE